MSDTLIDELIAGGWLYAALRMLFIALIYLFLFLVLRATVRDLNAVARDMAGGEGQPARLSLLTLAGAESSLPPGTAIPLEVVTTLGRIAGNTIVVADPHTSARHAEIRFERGQWWLRDLGSSNGTSLNGEPVRTVMAVRPGDVLQCGRVRFRLVPSVPVPGVDAST
ncbi:MAG: FHA domain-containing protein [Chloroflexia bacterium]|nr:FHA domain-containing protein [Chloroflexia bacterium]